MIRKPQSSVPFPLLLGIFLTSVASLTLEISLTRLLSVAQGYHFAFMVVSMALLGYGASGSFLSSFPFLLRRESSRTLELASWLFSLSTITAYLLSNLIPFDLARLSWDRWQILYVFLYYLAFSVPFFFSGLAISLALTRWNAQPGKLYGADLTGASLGCLIVFALFPIFGGPGTMVFSCLLSGLASIVFGWGHSSQAIFRGAWICFLVLLLCWPPSFLSQRLSPYKPLSAALLFPGARLLETHWNAFSRVDVLMSPAARTAPGLSLQYLDPLPPQLGLTVDANHLNAITQARGEPGESENLRFIDFLPSSFPYQLLTPGRVLIFEPGGGLEVLTALRHHTKEIVIVEANPIIGDLLQGNFREFSGGLYNRKETKFVLGDGRSFVRGKPPPFDLIVFPLGESLGASAAGISSLQEDYLLTTEAFQDYWGALKPGGFIAATLYLLPPPRGELRLIAVVSEALRRSGKSPGDHLLVFRSWSTITLLIKKGPVVVQESNALKSFCRQLRFDLVYYPGMGEGEADVYNRFGTPLYFSGVQKVLSGRKEFLAKYPFDLSPTTDDRPFFHHYFKWTHLGEIYRQTGEKWPILLEGGYLVPVVFFLALALSFFFILAPLLFSARKEAKPGLPGNRRFSWLLYFITLGLGFMFVEISLMQKFILFLGHPVYSIAIVLFSLLIFAGAGSRLSTRLNPRALRGLRLVLPMIAGLLLVYAFLLPQVLAFFQGHSTFSRQALTVLFIAPLGMFMGMPFPLAIRLLGLQEPSFIPWAWCANGCASVLGAILPVIIALALGFQTVFFLAALLYAAGFGLVWKSS